ANLYILFLKFCTPLCYPKHYTAAVRQKYGNDWFLQDLYLLIFPFATVSLPQSQTKWSALHCCNGKHRNPLNLSQLHLKVHLPNRWRSWAFRDRKSTRLNSSHVKISYAVFCLKKKKKNK